LLLKTARQSGVRPMIGLRCKLHTEGSGRWKSSTGQSAKFGLTTPEILGAVEELKDAGMLDCAKLLHFHLGSQVTDIQTVKDAVKEGARVYAKLRGMGLDLEYVDCGGGLGVDYDGTHTAFDSSMNYNLREYVNDVVYTIQEVCAQEKVPEPHILTESGRSLVAHHSLLVVNAFGAIEAGATPVELGETPGENDVVGEMRDIIKGIDVKNLAESYHDALQRRGEALTMFKLGFLSLQDKAKIEMLYWRLALEIAKLCPKAKYVPDDLIEMTRAVKDQYFCNFSVFQSVPDSWAVGQLFPIVPLQRLGEEPVRRATLVDITCDSDGKIAQFACHRNAGGSLPLHPLKPGEPYYLAICLIGAYQSAMGDIHNLFGRVNEVHVFEDETEPGGYYVDEVLRGQDIREVLETVQYNDFELIKRVKAAIEVEVKAGSIKPREGVDLLDQYEAVMQEYTYIEHSGGEAPLAAVPAAENLAKAPA